MTTRKIIALFILALMPAAAMMAQSIEGKWKVAEESLKTLDSDFAEGQVEMFFTFDKTNLEMIFHFDQTDDEMGTIGIEVSLPGKYKIEDSMLKNTFKHAEAKVEIYKLEFSEEVQKQMEANEQVKALVVTAISSEIDKNKDQFLSGLKLLGESVSSVKIIESNDSTIVLDYNGDQNIVLNKVE